MFYGNKTVIICTWCRVTKLLRQASDWTFPGVVSKRNYQQGSRQKGLVFRLGKPVTGERNEAERPLKAIVFVILTPAVGYPLQASHSWNRCQKFLCNSCLCKLICVSESAASIIFNPNLFKIFKIKPMPFIMWCYIYILFIFDFVYYLNNWQATLRKVSWRISNNKLLPGRPD